MILQFARVKMLVAHLLFVLFLLEGCQNTNPLYSSQSTEEVDRIPSHLKGKEKEDIEEEIDESEEKEQDIMNIEDEETDFHYFPRCEYYTRYPCTTHFAMNNPEYWGTYFRSTGGGGESGRSTRTNVASKTFKNLSLNIEDKFSSGKKRPSYNSRTGTFHNPYEFLEYSRVVEKPDEFQEEGLEQDLIETLQKLNLNNPLYEELLDYRNQICLQVFQRTLELLSDSTEKFEVIHHNEYPCLLIKIPFIQKFKKKSERKSWNKLFIAYYVAIVNKKAEKAGIPIEMVIRSSFGHLLPSIDVTGNSFRINVGIVPACYGEIIAESLFDLQNIIINKLNITLESYLYGEKDLIDKINNEIREYNNLKSTDKVLPFWQKEQRCYEILQLKGDPSGKNVICQITRKRAYIDLLADYVAEELDLDKEETNLTLPIAKMLGYLEFGKKVSMCVDHSYFQRNTRKWLAKENPLIKRDDQFWNLIAQAVKCIGGNANIYNYRDLCGLYSRLEGANKEFIIRSASAIDAEDGLGSDSECEAEILEGKKLYSKKIIVTTGMMAINVAHYLARYYLKQYLKIQEYQTEARSMYYETDDALKLSVNNEYKLAILNKENNIANILFFDLNHCDISGSQRTRLKHYICGSLFGKNIPIVVLDCTSSTSSHIKCAINDAIAFGVKFVLLVSSGLKNEQFGADNNPYGTVRIITLDKSKRDALYKEAKYVLKDNGGLPATAHKIRKGYKKATFSLTNQQILNADIERSTLEEEDKLNFAKLFKNNYEIIRYKKTLLKRIELLNKKFIQVSEESRKLIGETHATELERQTVIERIENILCELVTEELRLGIEDRIREEYQEKCWYYNKAYQEYLDEAEEDEDGGYEAHDYEGPIKLSPPDSPSLWDIRDKYGDLESLANLIKVSQVDGATLSQIVYDNFISIDGIEDIIVEMKSIIEASEDNTPDLSFALVQIILRGCDFQFYDLDPTQEGFLVRYLKESIEQRFEEIEIAYQKLYQANKD